MNEKNLQSYQRLGVLLHKLSELRYELAAVELPATDKLPEEDKVLVETGRAIELLKEAQQRLVAARRALLELD